MGERFPEQRLALLKNLYCSRLSSKRRAECDDGYSSGDASTPGCVHSLVFGGETRWINNTLQISQGGRQSWASAVL